MILDDEINATIVRPLPIGVTLHAIIDACHSGTVLDLPYLCRMSQNGQYIWENHSLPTGAYKGTSGGENHLAMLLEVAISCSSQSPENHLKCTNYVSRSEHPYFDDLDKRYL